MKCALLALLTGLGLLAPSLHAAEPAWIVDPDVPGEDLPAHGRSLFDHLVSGTEDGKAVYQVPFPFTRLIEAIQKKLPGATVEMRPPEGADYEFIFPYLKSYPVLGVP